MTIDIYVFMLIISVCFAIIAACTVFHFVIKKDFNRKLKLDVTIEQMQSAEDRISTFLSNNNLQVGCTIAQVAKILNIYDGGVNASLTDTQAHISEPNANGYRAVTFKAGLSDCDKQFAFAHECAHLINGDLTPATRPSGLNKAPCEQLADYTAAALLMPYSEVQQTLFSERYTTRSRFKRIKILKSLCKKYNVSEIVALRRISEVLSFSQLNDLQKP